MNKERKKRNSGIIHLLEALNTAAAADNVCLQATLQYNDREQLRADIKRLADVITELSELNEP